MTYKVLVIGENPDSVDFSDPALPPGMSAEKIRGGIALALRLMSERGWEAHSCLIENNDQADGMVEARLAREAYDCVIIGGGVRMPPSRLLLFERLINVVHRAAPRARIAFNTTPPDSVEAAARWLEP